LEDKDQIAKTLTKTEIRNPKSPIPNLKLVSLPLEIVPFYFGGVKPINM